MLNVSYKSLTQGTAEFTSSCPHVEIKIKNIGFSMYNMSFADMVANEEENTELKIKPTSIKKKKN